MHIHFDPVGGIAGDMFVGALLDLYPERAAAVIQTIRDAGLDPAVGLAHSPYTDGVLSGSRFEVEAPPADHHHQHVHWSALRTRLQESRLDDAVCARAVAIFSTLAEAEARVHNKPVEEVAFHEVGAWDSIADIVAAAYLIESLGKCSYSIGPIPVGSGRVKTDHGLLPLPAPASVLLLAGFDCFDDGLPGERVTPTGAAIINYLAPSIGLGPAPRRLLATGFGFGTRRFEGMSNVLRVIAYESATSAGSHDSVIELTFEIDDQTPEDLALGLERLRAQTGVIDIVQSTVVGKQGRMMNSIRVLARPAYQHNIVSACFDETSTLGIRLSHTERVILPREEYASSDGLNVKVADRPKGRSAKADIRDVRDCDGHQQRQAQRRAAEVEVLKRDSHDG